MNASLLLLGFGVGLVVGAAYFAGLWWTVRKATRVRRPALWLLASFVVRSLMAVGAFALVLRLGSPLALVVAMIGFLAARWLITRYLPSDSLSEAEPVEGTP